LYSVAVMLHEFITLRHYLADETTTESLLAAIMTKDVGTYDDQRSCPAQAGMPAELMYLAVKGMAKDPAQRPYATASEFVAELQRVLSGTFSINCKTTMTKRVLREMARAVDKHPNLVFYSLIGVVVTVLFTLVEIVRLVVT
jgi:eukaryotic-like serine/threonine-protein kinase